ncbi:MAG: hypothetical protein M3Q29_06470, partial [Chloroflexota bacterium]|nr:hypothetical protein [Chloroflexota bacterium]
GRGLRGMGGSSSLYLGASQIGTHCSLLDPTISLPQTAKSRLREEDRDRLLAYLHIFQRRRFPLPHRRLLSLATSPDDELASAALFALANLGDPEVRALALELIELERPPGGSPDLVLRLLIQNYQEGDHRIIERLLADETDRDEFHELGLRAMNVFEANKTPDAQDSLMLIYERGPCSTCREKCLGLLHSLDLLPDWIMDECRYDSNPEIRMQVRDWRGPVV